jgi:hypothetical protein
MLTKLACRSCSGGLVAEPAEDEFDEDCLKCLSCGRTEATEAKPAPPRRTPDTWSCGCPRADNYIVRRRGGVTYAGCAACWFADDAAG